MAAMMSTSYCYIYILTFVIAALWDVVLRIMCENYDLLPAFIRGDYMLFLQPYFKKHTLLSAALIAGFVGATSQVIILHLHKLPRSFGAVVSFMLTTFVVGVFYGILMRFSGLFPDLVEMYYNKLGVVRSMYQDGMSGLIIQATLLAVLRL